MVKPRTLSSGALLLALAACGREPFVVTLEPPPDAESVAIALTPGLDAPQEIQAFDLSAPPESLPSDLAFGPSEMRTLGVRYYPAPLATMGIPEGRSEIAGPLARVFGPLPPSPIPDQTRRIVDHEDLGWTTASDDLFAHFLSETLPLDRDGCFDFDVINLDLESTGEVIDIAALPGGSALVLTHPGDLARQQFYRVERRSGTWGIDRLIDLEDALREAGAIRRMASDPGGRVYLASCKMFPDVAESTLWLYDVDGRLEIATSTRAALDPSVPGRRSPCSRELIAPDEAHPEAIGLTEGGGLAWVGPQGGRWLRTEFRPFFVDAADPTRRRPLDGIVRIPDGTVLARMRAELYRPGPMAEPIAVPPGSLYRSEPEGPVEEELPLLDLESANALSWTELGLVLGASNGVQQSSFHLRSPVGDWTTLGTLSVQAVVGTAAFQSGFLFTGWTGYVRQYSPREGFCAERADQIGNTGINLAHRIAQLDENVYLVGGLRGADPQVPVRNNVAVIEARPRRAP